MVARLLLAFALALPLAAAAQDAHTVLHLLDYVGVDYPEAIEDGRIKNEDEYKEMLEFTAQVTERLRNLPANPAQAALLAQAGALAKLVRDKAPAAAIAEASGKLRWAIVGAYELRLAPKKVPDLALGANLYARHCAACHGAQGRGDGPAAKGLEPAPSNFRDLERMAQRSAYGLYNTITLGVAGTSMAAFKQLAEEDRWALAFFVANLGVPEARMREGEALWKAGEARAAFPDLGNVAALSTNEVVQRHGEKAVRVQDYLRAHPEAVAALKPSPIVFTIATLKESIAAYAKGERAGAQQLAITAYLEGFELVEASLDNVDRELRVRIEREMMAFRNSLKSGVPLAQVEQQAERIESLLKQAQERLASGVSAGATFTSSLLILLREGLEAILVLAAIFAFVVKTRRRDALPYVHAGWIAALALGVATWFVATYVADVSGADREVTEGVTALLAAAMLIYVGFWLHSKAYAQRWQQFIREQVGAALEKRTLWAMAAVSFLAVYREMFEIVLFYQALWVQAGVEGRGPLLGGIAAAAAMLLALGWLIFKYSMRLPIGPFFAVSSTLLALLAVVFAGQGVAALQEAGKIPADAVDFVRLPAFGIFPTSQTLLAQLVVLAIVIGVFYLAGRGSVPRRA